MLDPQASSFYDEGVAAYEEGKDFWECPYVLPDSYSAAMQPWLAGWMMAKQYDPERTK